MKKIKNPKVEEIKKAIKNGTYDMIKAIERAADRIVDNPWVLLIR